MNTFQIFTKNVYGVQKVYPANDVAQKFATLLAVKTFNTTQLAQIKGLGYAVEQVIDPDSRIAA